MKVITNASKDLKTAEIKTFRQSDMSAECFLIQLSGPSSCETCEANGTSECGGRNIKKTGKNEKGVKVPLPDQKGRVNQ